MPYDDAYKEIPDYFGTEPSLLLTDYIHLLDKSKPVLDIGAGQGRNSFFLARQGLVVDALEPSQVGTNTMAQLAAQENLTINACCSGFEEFIPEHPSFGTVLLFGIIQVLPWNSLSSLAGKIMNWTAPGSHILVSAFSIADPGFDHIAALSQKIGKNSFRINNDNFRTFLEPGEILTLFKDCKPIHHWEGMGPEHRHGGKEPHKHAVIHAVFRV